MNDSICRSPLLLSADESVLVVVDVQDKLLSVIPGSPKFVWNLRRLVHAANLMEIPALATEQYPEKLGRTTPELEEVLQINPAQPDVPGKLTFSCGGCNDFVALLRDLGRRQVVIGGLETHVCVLQTAFDLSADGFDVALVVDALAARFETDHRIALRRMESSGMTLTTTEGVMFEWCQRAGTDVFRQVSQLVRQSPPEEKRS